MSRRFNGSNTNYLQIPNLNAARGSTSDCSFVFVVRVMQNKAAGSIFGMHDGSDGIGIRLNTGSSDNKTAIQLHNNASGRSPADQHMVGIDCFVGIVNDTGANECRFYFGYSADSMASLGSAGTALTFSGSAMPDALIGALNVNGAAGEAHFAVVDKMCIFYDTVLTLTDIKLVAACGNYLASSATRYYEMGTGTGDETDSSPANDTALENGTVESFRELCGSGESAAKARHFDGVNDILNTGLNAARGSTHVTSSYAWIVLDQEGLFGEIYGFDITERLRFLAQYGSGGTNLALDVFCTDGGPIQRSCDTAIGADARGVPLFVAWVNDVAANRFRFYWGFTPETVVEVDEADFTTATTAVQFDQPGNPAATVYIGGIPGGHTSSRFYRGTIDTVGLEFDTLLSLEDLQQRASCGESAGTHYWEIDGTSPESNGATVTGDPVVVDGICQQFTFVGPQVSKVAQVIEAHTAGIAVAKVVQVIEYLGAGVHIVEHLDLDDDPDGDGRVFTLKPLKYILEHLHLSELWKPMAHFKLLLTEILDLNDTLTGENVGIAVILNNIFRRPLKFMMQISRRIFFGRR